MLNPMTKEENDRRNEECKKRVELLELQIETLDNYRNNAERILSFAEGGSFDIAKGVLVSMSDLINLNKKALQTEIDSIKGERDCADKIYQLLSSKEKEDVE